jgi:hypothetical protein
MAMPQHSPLKMDMSTFGGASCKRSGLSMKLRLGRNFFQKYRNKYTDNGTVGDANIVFWCGMLLTTKEDGPPFAIDRDFGDPRPLQL